MKTEELIEGIKKIYLAYAYEWLWEKDQQDKCFKEQDEIILRLQQGEKDRVELEKIRAGDYPEIEKIFIDFDVRIHKMRNGEEIGKAYPLYAKYYDGYKECYNDIRDRIRELIKIRKSEGERTEKKVMEEIRKEKQATEALKKIKRSEDGINERGKNEGRKKLIDKEVKDNGRG